MTLPESPERRYADAVAWAQEQVGSPVRAVRELAGSSTSAMLALTHADGPGTVLRLITREPWRTHGEALTTRESAVQRELAGTGVPAPRTLALDAAGVRCGHPAHLMTLVPGEARGTVDDAGLAEVARVLAAVHGVVPTIEVRTYQSWAWEAKYVVPGWARRPALWSEAFELLRQPPPAYEPVLLHRDFAVRNLLWVGDRVSGVVDWVETSTGPAWLDVAHCATNLALLQGGAVATAFQDAYAAATGRVPAPYWDVMDVVGFLPPPGRAPFTEDPAHLSRLEDRLAAVMSRL